MPGSPSKVTIRPRPDRASSKHAFSSPISRCRPTNTPPARLSKAWASSTSAPGCSTLVVTSIASNADNTSEADSGRSDGSLASNRRMRASKDRGHPELCHVGATGGVLMCWPMMATESSPKNGGRPVTISYNMAPREYRSDCGVTSPPMACSGGMYDTVPTIIPSVVRRDRSMATARPKSPILATASLVSQTLPGFKSRWTMPRE